MDRKWFTGNLEQPRVDLGIALRGNIQSVLPTAQKEMAGHTWGPTTSGVGHIGSHLNYVIRSPGCGITTLKHPQLTVYCLSGPDWGPK